MIERTSGPLFFGIVAAALAASCGGGAAETETRASSAPTVEVHGDPGLEGRYEEPVRRVVAASREADFAWGWLETLCADIGHRLSGSEPLERAVHWAGDELREVDGVRVELQPVEVNRWVRGEESLVLLGDDEEPLPMIGLGNSAGTGGEPLEGEVVVLTSMEELESRAEEVRGKIVLFDVPMPPYDEEAMRPGYGEVVGYRVGGPAAAGAVGATAVLLRSLTNDADSPPHTGVTHYAEDGPRIPAAAITVRDAERLHAMVDAGETVRVRLSMEAHDDGVATSHNVIAEIEGAEAPDEYVIFGGHIDTWDVGQGCHDDGAGVVSAMAAIRILRELGLTPRRSLRAVLWTNEENGLAGARAYAADHAGDGLHVAGIESDIGAAPVIGLSFQVPEGRSAATMRQIQAITNLLHPIGVDHGLEGFSGADLSPMRELGMPGIGIIHDPAHYFDLHHTSADTFEAVDRDAFLQGVAAITATAYLVADMEPRLGEEG